MRFAVSFLVAVAITTQAAPTLDTMLDRLSQYLLAYESRISEIVADEQMTQFVLNADFAREGQRRLQSEVAFMRLPGSGPWLGYREVQTVNGRAVTVKERMRALLTGNLDNRKRAVEIAHENGKHNLGSARTTNVPTLVLELMHPRHRSRFSFKLHNVERIRGKSLRRISFEEIARPTLIQKPEGGDIRARGSLWLDEPTGRLYEAEVRQSEASTRDGRVAPESVLRITFVDHKELDMLVPGRMTETFAASGGVGNGEAQYSNFRRFTTAARIVPQ